MLRLVATRLVYGGLIQAQLSREPHYSASIAEPVVVDGPLARLGEILLPQQAFD